MAAFMEDVGHQGEGVIVSCGARVAGSLTKPVGKVASYLTGPDKIREAA